VAVPSPAVEVEVTPVERSDAKPVLAVSMVASQRIAPAACSPICLYHFPIRKVRLREGRDVMRPGGDSDMVFPFLF
jgi:hypothetical protein